MFKCSMQPLKFSKEIYNVRKLRELPHCLLEGRFIDELKETVLSNPEWIMVKSEAFSIKGAATLRSIRLAPYQPVYLY